MSGYDVLVDYIHRTGVESTANFQNWFLFMGDFLVWISAVFDPSYTYTLYFPLLYHLKRPTGLQMLWTGAISEWLNHVFKCILFGERPYWWVRENSHIWQNLNATVPYIFQTSITCETGPGSPSGHVMVNAAVGFVFVKGVLGKTKRKWLKTLSWTIYFVWLLLIAISRVYIAAHFPHQCFFGLLSGVCLGFILHKVPIIIMKLNHQVLLGILMAGSAVGTYSFIQYLGIDPSWTVPLAQKWCFRADWVHLSTTLFYMFWRYIGTVIGIALSLAYERTINARKTNINFGYLQIFALVVGSIVAVNRLTSLIIKTGDDYLMLYSSAFVVHIFLPIIVMEALPWIVVTISNLVNHRTDEMFAKHRSD